MNERAQVILHFWFNEIPHKQRFTKNESTDQKIRTNFLQDYIKATNNEYDDWQKNSKECLALILLLDQFSRNLFRNDERAFAMDKKAKKIAIEAINYRYHEKLNQDQVMFIFLPFMHSEDLQDQIYCGQFIDNYFKGNPSYKQAKKYSIIHKDIIEKFGRFPYRNKVLKRVSTKEEKIYLKSTHHDFFNI